ncbi:MAG TPA: DUF2262 domain-containing protein [Clostridiales bacterium]|nr:DUF2262 domain-containing protein [Clostridiales bacterium]
MEQIEQIVYFKSKFLKRKLYSFVLDDMTNWYEGYIRWRRQQVKVSFNNGDAKHLEKAMATLGQLINNQRHWENALTAYAAKILLPLKNESWLDDDEEEDTEQPVTMSEFIGRMTLEAIDLYDDGSFDFWFNDGDLFFGHVISVQGDLISGANQASIHG